MVAAAGVRRDWASRSNQIPVTHSLRPGARPLEYPMSTTPERSHAVPTSGGLFRAFWRWHFYSSLLVIPVFLMLSITGLLYLFRFQLEPVLHQELLRVDRPVSPDRVSLEQQLAKVKTQYPQWQVTAATEPRTDRDPTRFSVSAGEQSLEVFVNPSNGKILGDLNPDTTLSGYAIRLHGELLSGRLGDGLIELASCWAIVMTITGLYLFFYGRKARRRLRQAKSLRTSRSAQLRSAHGLVGLGISGGILLLVISGLPWTGFWGEQVQKIASHRGASMWSADPGAQSDSASTMDESLPHSHDVPWAQGAAEIPQSRSSGKRRATIETAVYQADQAGLPRPLTIILPADESGVYSVMSDAFHNPGRERTIHVDQYSGDVLSEYGYPKYSALAKTVSQGIAVHEGRRFGIANMIWTTLFCVGVIFLCLSGPVMWWRRRPQGRPGVGAPRGRMPIMSKPLLATGLLTLGVALPLFGGSLIALLLADAIRQRVRSRAEAGG